MLHGLLHKLKCMEEGGEGEGKKVALIVACQRSRQILYFVSYEIGEWQGEVRLGLLFFKFPK